MAVVDDHFEARSGIRRLISAQEDMQVVGEAASGEASIHLCNELKPDVVVVDLRLPGIDGIETARRIARLGWGTSIVIVSVSDNEDDRRLAHSEGVIRFLRKSRLRHELLPAIHFAFSQRANS